MNINFKYSNDDNTTVLRYGQNGVPYITFKKLDDTGLVLNGFSTRLGGVSREHLSSLNLGSNRGDDRENVMKNHEIIADAIGFDYKNLVTANQTHTTNVRVVTKEDCGKGIIKPRDYSDVDGLVTNERNVVLVTYYADCVPLYLLDVKNKVIGLSHSGWKGTVGKMGSATLKVMKEHFKTNPMDVVACIGPSICRDCYEVSGNVALQFENAFGQYRDRILTYKGNDKYQLDLWEANKLVLIGSGIPECNIAVTDICTCCNKDLLFSHRGHNGMRGNMAAFLMLK